MMKKQNSEITCPYKSANVNRSPQQLQSFSTPPIRQIVKHGLDVSGKSFERHVVTGRLARAKGPPRHGVPESRLGPSFVVFVAQLEPTAAEPEAAVAKSTSEPEAFVAKSTSEPEAPAEAAPAEAASAKADHVNVG